MSPKSQVPGPKSGETEMGGASPAFQPTLWTVVRRARAGEREAVEAVLAEESPFHAAGVPYSRELAKEARRLLGR